MWRSDYGPTPLPSGDQRTTLSFQIPRIDEELRKLGPKDKPTGKSGEKRDGLRWLKIQKTSPTTILVQQRIKRTAD